MNTNEFIEKLSKDTSLQENMKDVNSAEKFYEFATANGLTDDFDTMKATALQLFKSESETSEVDLKTLTEISGGESTVESIIDTVISVTALGSCIYSATGTVGAAAAGAV